MAGDADGDATKGLGVCWCLLELLAASSMSRSSRMDGGLVRGVGVAAKVRHVNVLLLSSDNLLNDHCRWLWLWLWCQVNGWKVTLIKKLTKVLPCFTLVEACLAAIALQAELTMSTLIEECWCCLAAPGAWHLASDLVKEAAQHIHGTQMVLEQCLAWLTALLSLLLLLYIIGGDDRHLSGRVEPPGSWIIPSCWLKAASVPAKSIEEVDDDLLGVRMSCSMIAASKHLLLIGFGQEITDILDVVLLGELEAAHLVWLHCFQPGAHVLDHVEHRSGCNVADGQRQCWAGDGSLHAEPTQLTV
mgnify:CR=1 FL=1